MTLSYASAAILQALSRGYGYGFDVMDVTGLPSGTVYPALRRLEREKLAVSRWEDQKVAARENRPARKYYELTRGGRVLLTEAAARYPALERMIPENTSR